MVGRRSHKKPRRAAWLLTGAARGSGGFRTVLVHAEALKEIGITSEFYYYDKIYDAPILPSLNDVKWYDKLHRGLFNPADKIRSKITRMGLEPENIHVGWEAHAAKIASADVVFATTWPSAYAAQKFNKRGKKIYFVQGHEHWCVPRGDNYYMICNSCRLGIDTVTIGRSMCRHMQDEFGARAFYYDYGADLQAYYRDESIKRADNRIVFLFQPKKADRCAGLGLEALRLVRKARPNVEIILYGSRPYQNKITVPFKHEHRGLLPIGALNKLFNSAPIGLSLSAANPSRTSFEMMACGMIPVELYGEHSVYDFPSNASVLAHPSPEALANALLGLLKDKRRRQKMSEAAVKFMARRDQKTVETPQFLALVEAITAGKKLKQTNPQKLYKKISNNMKA